MRKNCFTIAYLVLQGCAVVAAGGTPAAGRGAESCEAAPRSGQYSISAHSGGSVTICSAEDPVECHDNPYLQAFEYARPDLNGDGTADYMVRIMSGLVGTNNEVNYFAGYLACRGGYFVSVLFDALSRVDFSGESDANGYLELRVTRDCYSDVTGDVITRHYTLSFDAATGRYGPPNGNKALKDFCGAYEQSLPNRQ